MAQHETDSLEKQSKIETVHHRAGVTLGVNFSKALAATSAQMQDTHRALHQNPGSEPQEKVEILASYIEPCFWAFLNFKSLSLGKLDLTARGKVLVEPVQRCLSIVVQIGSVVVCTRTFCTANTEHQVRWGLLRLLTWVDIWYELQTVGMKLAVFYTSIWIILNPLE